MILQFQLNVIGSIANVASPTLTEFSYSKYSCLNSLVELHRVVAELHFLVHSILRFELFI